MDEEPKRSIITESADAVVVMWHLLPGQRIRPHVHPDGQDTWIVISGSGEYSFDEGKTTAPISRGQIVVAHLGQVHGVLNNTNEPLQILSVVSPADAGYFLV
ncbi:MAG: cupin domain-containing protein [Betaproteobacteria bacterium HGW-Betaproteobacteria-12]|nr:MAG: cupin domain-containing protein [Betaproteobacteria bacterium HGW-Betaproteobacteria-12]